MSRYDTEVDRLRAELKVARALHVASKERDEARAEVERLRDEVAQARADVERIRSAYERYGAAGVASVLAELSHRVGHPSDSTRHGTMISDVGDDNTGEV